MALPGPLRRWPPPVLRHVSPGQVALSRCCGLHWPRALALCDRRWTLVCQALERPPAHALAVELVAHGQVWRIASTTADLQLLLVPWIGALPVEALPSKVLLGVLQDVASAAFGGMAADLRPSSPGTPAQETSLRLALHATTGPPTSVALWATAPDASWCSLRPPASLVTGPGRLAAWRKLVFAARIELGWSDLPLMTVKGLRAGDVIVGHVIAKPAPHAAFVLRLSRHLGIHCVHLDRGRAAAKGRLTMIHDEQAPDPDAGDNPNSSEAPLLDDLPVRLSFDLGGHSMLLEQLQAVHEGHVFDLGLLPHNAVTIRLNGFSIGEGELVDIDGRIGVAVVNFNSRLQ